MIGGLPYVLDAGLGVGLVTPGAPASHVEPTEAVVPSGPNAAIGLDCEGPFDPLLGAVHWHSARKYERMYLTPAVGSSFNALRAAVLSGGVGLLPAVKPAPGLGKPGQVDGSAVEGDMAAEIADSNRRCLDAWDTPVDLVLWEMMEAMYLGHVLAEPTAAEVIGGPDDGLLAVRTLRPLHRGNYRFLVDPAGRVAAINARTVDGSWKELDADHFAWLTWDPHRGDPRGRSCFRMAVEAWDMLVALWPEIMKGWKQFGTPCTYGTLGPNDTTPIPLRDSSGNVLSGKTVTPIQALAAAGVQLRNGKFVALSHGSTMGVLESSKDATVVSGALGLLEGLMVKSILLTTRGTVEAKHGSRADSETAQDVTGTLIRFVRKWLERFLRGILVRQNSWNYGPDVARRLTPLVTLGDHEHQDFPAVSAGVGLLFQSAYFTDKQLPYVDTFLGLPQRQPGDVRVGPTGAVSDTPPDPAADPNAPAAPAPEPAAHPAGGTP